MLDLSGQSVEQKFVEVVDEIREIKPFRAMHGPIRKQNGLGEKTKLTLSCSKFPFFVGLHLLCCGNHELPKNDVNPGGILHHYQYN